MPKTNVVNKTQSITSQVQGQIKSRMAYEEYKKKKKKESDSAKSAANTIKKNVDSDSKYGTVTKGKSLPTKKEDKTNVSKKTTQYGSTTKGRGLTKEETAQTKQNVQTVKQKAKNKYDKLNTAAKEAGIYKRNPDVDTGKTVHKQYKYDGKMHVGTGSGGNDRSAANSDPYLMYEAQKTMANTASGRFVKNFGESLANNSALAVIPTMVTGKKMTDTQFMSSPFYNANPELQPKLDELNEKAHQGIAAGLGNMAGIGVNYALGRAALNPQFEQATNAIMNGTRLGNSIKSSSALGKIGQSLGTKTAENIANGLVKETISDATLGFGQNALINYGQGLRGKDFWKQQAMDTALDFGIGGMMEGLPIASQIKQANKITKNIIEENPARMLNPSISKEDYLADLWQRMKSRMGTHNNADNGIKMRDAAYNKIDDLMEEYNKVVDMDEAQFNRYRQGLPIDEVAEEVVEEAAPQKSKLNKLKETKNEKHKERYSKMKSEPAPEETVTIKPESVEEAAKETKKTKAQSSKKKKAEVKEPEVEPVKETTAEVKEPETVVKETKTKVDTRTPSDRMSYKTLLNMSDSEEKYLALKKKVERDINKNNKLDEQVDKEYLRLRETYDADVKARKAESVKAEEPQPKVEEKPAPVKEAKAETPKTEITESGGYKIGDKVEHNHWGKGTVVGFDEETGNTIIKFGRKKQNIPHEAATKNGILKHADETAETIKPEKSNPESITRTALVKDENGAVRIVRKDGYKSNREFEQDLRDNGYKVSKTWAGDKDEQFVNEWDLYNRNPRKPKETTNKEKSVKTESSVKAEEKVEAPVKEAEKTLPTAKEVKEATNPETTSREALEKLTVQDLKNMSNQYHVTVKGTGAKGNKVHKDYVDALEKYFNEKEAAQTVQTTVESSNVASDLKITSSSSKKELVEYAKANKYSVDDSYSRDELYKSIKFQEKLRKNASKQATTETVSVSSSAVEAKGVEIPKATKDYSGDEKAINDFVESRLKDNDSVTFENISKRAKSKGADLPIDSIKKYAEEDGRFEIVKNQYGKDAIALKDTSSTTSSAGTGTATFTSSNDLPKGRKVVQSKKLKQSKVKTHKLNEELPPKGAKAKAEGTGKKLDLNSKFKDVIEHFKGKDEGDVFGEAEAAWKKYKGKDTSKTFGTYLFSEDIAPETKRLIIKRRETNSAYIKDVITDESVLTQAKKNIENDFEGTAAAVKRKIENGERFTKQDNADLLLAAQHYDELGEFAKADELYALSQPEITNAAQVLAFQRWHYKTTPAGRAYSAISLARKIAKENNAKNIKINDSVIEAIYNAKTEKEITDAINAFKLDIWNQIPPSFMEKANAWRYLSMLGNPKTHVRNILGNALFYPARVISDSLATAIERGLSKKIKSLGGEAGTHAILNRASTDDRALLKLAADSFKKHKAAMESASSKFYDMMRPMDSPTFTGKGLNLLSNTNTKLLEKEDEFFMGLTYRSAYAQYLKAHGIKASDITEEIAERASKYAQNEALKATYRDSNQLATALNKFRKNLKPTSKDSALTAAGKTATGFLMDSTIPFVKTPLNILKRGAFEYSPAGVLRGLNDIAKAKNSDQLLKGIEYFSNGLTGSGVMLVGWYLGKQGIVNGSLGDWDKKVAYDKTQGAQDYAVTIGDNSITLDWIAPMSMPFFVGVEAGTKGGSGDASKFINALSNMTNPIFEMSMLQGIENTFNTAISDSNGLSTIAKNAGFNYLSQYVPTLAGQITRTFVNKNRKTALSTSTDPLQREIEKQLGKIINKTPLSSGLSQDYVDQWGRTEKSDGFFENFLSPAYITKKNVTSVDKEINRLYDALGEEDKDKIIPTVNSNAYMQEFDGKEYVMTPAEFTQYKKTVGQAKYKGLEELFSTDRYKNASADEQRKMIENVYDEANKKGKTEYLTKVSKEYASAPDFYALDSSQREKYDETLDISKENWAKAYTSMTKAYKEVKANSGETLTNAEKAFVLAKSGFKTLEQAQSINKNITEKVWERAQNAVKSGKTLEQMQEEAEARENMSDTEKKYTSYFKARSDSRYDGKTVSKDVYQQFLDEVWYVDQHNPDKSKRNGAIQQSEAYTAIETIAKRNKLSKAQKAYFWKLAENDGGWKRNPYA